MIVYVAMMESLKDHDLKNIPEGLSSGRFNVVYFLASVSRTRHDTMYTRGLFADSCRKRSSSSRTLTKLCSDAQHCSQL